MISIVIPTLNEERALPATLTALRRQSVAHEVIVSDGGSSDRTFSIAQAAGVRWVNAARGRGAQMNAGAHMAGASDWLLFLHADTLLPKDALNTIAALPDHVEAGCFQQAFSGHDPLHKRISQLHNWRCRRTRIMYGDQAIFVRRGVFEVVGGFPESDLEDVKLSELLRARSAPVLLDAKVITDARKFEAHGGWRCLLRIVVLLLCHRYHRQLPDAARRFFEPVR